MANDFKLTIAKFSGGVGRAGISTGDFSVTDIRELQRRLKAIDPKLRTELLRDSKDAAKPVESAVKTAIRSIEPLSGMRKDRGRLGWGVGVPVDKTQIQFRTSGGGKSLTTSLVRVKVNSPAVALADMAGRSGRYVGRGRRNDNAAPSLKARNANPNKGAAFIRSLNANIGDGKASRFIWPAAEASIPKAKLEVEKILRKAYDKINRQGI